MSLALYHRRLRDLIKPQPEFAGIVVITEEDLDLPDKTKRSLIDPGAFVLIRGGDLKPMVGSTVDCALMEAHVPVVLCLNDTKLQPSWTLAKIVDALVRAIHGQPLYCDVPDYSKIRCDGGMSVPNDDDGIQTAILTFIAPMEFLPNSQANPE